MYKPLIVMNTNFRCPCCHVVWVAWYASAGLTFRCNLTPVRCSTFCK